MISNEFLKKQISDIREGGIKAALRKGRLLSEKIIFAPLYVAAVPFVIFIRSIRPFCLVRIGGLVSNRIGHFAANTELYFCERDEGINAPKGKYIDVFYLKYEPLCNQQLLAMWERLMIVLPKWFLAPIDDMNKIIPGGKIHQVGNNAQHDRDIHNLLDKYPAHLEFSKDEELKGEAALRAMGVPENSKFVCLIVRDSAYLSTHIKGGNFNYHDFRDSDIANYVAAAESLAKCGVYVIRMGAKVNSPISSNNPMVIDYATNGMRSDFLDVYLGAKCFFCISQGTGFDAIPIIFRKPVVYVNMVPVSYFFTFAKATIGIFKHHIDIKTGRELSFKEIFGFGVGQFLRSKQYKDKGVKLIENTPEEIRDVVLEMFHRLEASYESDDEEICNQEKFWKIFPTNAVDDNLFKPLHGEIRSRVGASYLKKNSYLLN